MSKYTINIEAVNMRDLKLSLKEWCESLNVMPDLDPHEVMDMIDLDTLRIHFERRMSEMGMSLDIKAMVDEVVEVKAPKRARKEKAAAEPEELVISVDEADPSLEAVKADVIRRCQAIFVEPGGKAVIDDIIARHGNGITKLSAMPASAFPAIAEELEE